MIDKLIATVTFGIAVTRLEAVVLIETLPEEVAPTGAASCTLRIVPAGIFVLSFPVITRTELRVVKLYVVESFVTIEGCCPATAEEIVMAAGFPDTSKLSPDRKIGDKKQKTIMKKNIVFISYDPLKGT